VKPRSKIEPRRHLVYSPEFRERLEATRAKVAASRERLRLLDRRDSLATLIEAKTQQIAAHAREFEEIERQLGEGVQ